MEYIIVALSILIIGLLILKIKIQITNNNNKFQILIIIGFIKYKVDIKKMISSQKFSLEKTKKDLLKLKNPLIFQIFKNIKTSKCNVLISIPKEHPYLLFNANMLLLMSTRNVKRKKICITFGEEIIKYDIIFSIGLKKLVKIILSNFKDFKLLTKKEVS